jgi:hypothetical protein
MADSQDERKRITEELARMRVSLRDQTLLLRRNLDVGAHMSNSLRKYSWGWVSIAAIFGWILSRLPARKKKIYIHTANSGKQSRGGAGVMTHIWKGIWAIARPVLTAYLTKKIGEKAKRVVAKQAI